jgi:hypothetical protein
VQVQWKEILAFFREARNVRRARDPGCADLNSVLVRRPDNGVFRT